MADIFISYSSANKHVADAICHGLEREGIRCWIAPRDAKPGQTYQGSIIRAIRECRVMVLVFSSESNDSGHVLRELHTASEAGKPIVPFRIEDVVPGDDMYYYVATLHWLDALTPPLEEHIARLIETLRDLDPALARGWAAPGRERHGRKEPERVEARRAERGQPAGGGARPTPEPAGSAAAAGRGGPTPNAGAARSAGTGKRATRPHPTPTAAAGLFERPIARVVGAAVIVGVLVVAVVAGIPGQGGARSGPAGAALPLAMDTPLTSTSGVQESGPAAPPPRAAPAPDPLEPIRNSLAADWRSRLVPGHEPPDARSLLAYTLTIPGSEPYLPRTRDAESIVTRSSRPIDASILTGEWQCRSLQIRSSGGWSLHPYFRCRIELDAGRLMIRKLTGSQRFAGEIYRYRDDLFVVLANTAVNEIPIPPYRADGIVMGLEQVGPSRLRLSHPREIGPAIFDLVR